MIIGSLKIICKRNNDLRNKDEKAAMHMARHEAGSASLAVSNEATCVC